jgi:myo-inositol-hexaphosphate 3-phosphohydrolase
MKIIARNSSAIKIALVITLCVCSAQITLANGSSVADTIYIQKSSVKKAYRIALYPDADQKAVFFSVRGTEGKVYQLYVFDVEGKLVHQAETRNKETIVVKGIDKGVYQFEVMSDDERIGNGQIAIR